MGEARADAGRPEPWELVSQVEEGEYEIFRTRKVRTRSPKDDAVHTFHLVDSPDGVAVLALTPGGELVLVEQFRHGLRGVTVEIPSGIVDRGEAPEAAARRELREETGFEGEELEHVGTLALNPSWQTTRVHVVLVRNVRPAAERDPDPTEDIRVRTLPLAQVRRMALDGEIDSAVVLAALALLDWRGTAPAGAEGTRE